MNKIFIWDGSYIGKLSNDNIIGYEKINGVNMIKLTESNKE